jgi:hypothetical protein
VPFANLNFGKEKTLLQPRNANNAKLSKTLRRSLLIEDRNQSTSDSSAQLSASGLPIHQKHADDAKYHADERFHRQAVIEKCPCH